MVSSCISYTTNGTSDKYVNLTGDHLVLFNSSKWYKVTNPQVMDTGSSKGRGEVISKGVSSSDFISASIPQVGTDFNKLWRNADGTINTNGAAIISSSSEYGTFSKDGSAIGARFAESNKVKALTVNIDSNSSTVVPGGDTEEKPSKPSEPDKPVNPPVEEPSKPSEDVSGNINVEVSGASTIVSQAITSNMKITTNKSYDLSKLKICYYFTGDGADDFQGSIYGGISYTRAPWYVSLDGISEISVKKMTKLGINADSCAEITFSGDSVLDSTAALNINLSIAKRDWSNFEQSNDYSYNDSSKIIVYYDGVVISGKAF